MAVRLQPVASIFHRHVSDEPLPSDALDVDEELPVFGRQNIQSCCWVLVDPFCRSLYHIQHTVYIRPGVRRFSIKCINL